jgi:hypothetical protein
MIPFLLAGAGAAASAALARGLFYGYPERSIDGRAIGAKEQAIIAACADAFFPPGGPIPISGTAAGLVGYFDEYVARLPKSQALLVHLLVWFIEHAPWVFGPKRVRFSSLGLDARIAVLQRMHESPIYFRRIAFLSMRTILTMGYLAHPEVMRAMRMVHDPSPFERAAAPSVTAEAHP